MGSERVVGVIGSGTMGAGIAEVAATAGFVVQTTDLDPGIAKKAHGEIARRLDRRVADGKLSRRERDEVVSRLRVAKGHDGLRDAEYVVEAVPEDLALKQKVFRSLDGIVSPRALLATNTSSLSIAKIAEGSPHADRLVGLHFFNPAAVMELVELVRGPATSDQAMVDARAFCTMLGKTPVRVLDSPGFIGNRVNRPFYLEALHLLETGEADIRSIDHAVKEIGDVRMGPFELMDLIGLDVSLRVTETVHNDFDRPARFAPSRIQRKLVASGHLGRKSRRGFYEYSDGEPMPALETPLKDISCWRPTPALRASAEALARPADRAFWIFARIFAAVINEAALVADTIALPRDVNLAMELGFGYAEGPLATADHIGLDTIQELLTEFHVESGQADRFKPNPLLDRHVTDGNLGEKTARGFLHHAL